MAVFALPILAAAAAVMPASGYQAPSGRWLVDYADSMCVLSRDYGEGANKLTIGLRPWPMSAQTEIIVLTRRRGRFGSGPATVSLLPAGHSSTGSFQRFPLPKDAGTLSTLTMDQDALAGLDKAVAITLQLGAKEVYSVAIPNIAPAIKVLKGCQDDLLKHWGLDPKELETVLTPPTGKPSTWFHADDYPADAIRARAQGRTITVLTVATDGKVRTCKVVMSSGTPALDQVTCDILQHRSRLSPGLDKNGKPIESHMVIPVVWVLPGVRVGSDATRE